MHVEEWASELNKEMFEKWKCYENKSDLLRHGFNIFSSPVHVNPTVMIITLNPGGDKDFKYYPQYDQYKKGKFDTVDNNNCIYNCSNFFTKLLDIFAPYHYKILDESVRMQILFYRSKNIELWNKKFKSDKKTKKELESYCYDKTIEGIKLIKPKLLLIAGIETFHRLNKNKNMVQKEPCIESYGKDNREREIYFETTWPDGNIPILTIIHPSRFTNHSKGKIKSKLNEILSSMSNYTATRKQL